MIDQGERQKTSHGRETTLSFPDIVGQDELKEALLAVVANDGLGGLLIRGEKGTAKSTAVRALPDLLPPQEAIEGCPYGCPPDPPGQQCADCRERTDPQTVERPAPLVTLPLGATRDRVVGTLSVAGAMDGDFEFEPGLLARANRGILYVDEVNLLDDHLVDVLLDAAASGVNRVERDGVSVSHPASFSLVGSMNPEEGDLRPQLRDRFALQATVTACDDVEERVAIIDRALGRTSDRRTNRAPSNDRWTGGGRSDESDAASERTRALRRRLRRARAGVEEVELPGELAVEIATLCRDAGVDGHRGDIATAGAAITFAALDGRSAVAEGDVRRAAELALPHRLQSRPFEESADVDEVIDEHFDGQDRPDADAADDSPDRASNRGESDEPGRAEGDGGEPDGDEAEADGPRTSEDAGETDPSDASGTGHASGGTGRDGRTERGTQPTGDADDVAADEPGTERGVEGERDDERSGGGDAVESGEDPEPEEGTPLVPGQAGTGVGESRAPDVGAPEPTGDAGRRAGAGSVPSSATTVDGDGPRLRTRRADSDRHVDAAASVRAAAARGADAVERRDLRRSVRRRDCAALVLFVVDASASMRPAMRAAKGTVLELLKDVYRQRDEVAFVAFAGEGADVLLPPTSSVTLAARHLKDLPVGDRTPLPAGLRTACEVLDRAEPAASVVVLVTDGRANVAEGSPVGDTRAAARELADRNAHVLVVDAGDGGAGLSEVVAEETRGERVPLAALTAQRVDEVAGAATKL